MLALQGRASEAKSFCHSLISFDEFVDRYGRAYAPGTEEYDRRASIFAKRVAAVNEHNCGPNRGHTWRASINNLADWEDEALDRLSGHNLTGHSATVGVLSGEDLEPYTLLSQPWRRRTYPASVSWGHLNAISEPRHQGHCGSCWALTAVTVVSAHSEMRNRPSDFSLSQVVACTPNPDKCGGTGGCHGATSGLAFNYILHAGLEPSATFPYPYGDVTFKSDQGLACPATMAVDPAKARSTLPGIVQQDGNVVHRLSSGGGHRLGMVGWKRIAKNKEEQLVRALVEDGPLAVSVATGRDWHIYGGGVFPSTSCDPEHVLRHATVLFGYGVDDDTSLRYWHLKNSWGEDWGEGGTMRLERLPDEEALCGWDEHPEKGSECAGGRKRVWVCGSCGIIYEATIPIFE